MIEMEKPRVECVEKSEDGKYARFEVEPLERGYGMTLGNSLRRVRLSSLPGAAASATETTSPSAIISPSAAFTQSPSINETNLIGEFC